jgi:hypothetical protein
MTKQLSDAKRKENRLDSRVSSLDGKLRHIEHDENDLKKKEQ